MNDHTRLTGPSFLEELADNQQANGFNIMADQLRERAREWSRDKQAIANGTPIQVDRKDGSKAFSASLIEADPESNRLVLRPDDKGPRVTTARYHLIPIGGA
jgi:hypothetical protein